MDLNQIYIRMVLVWTSLLIESVVNWDKAINTQATVKILKFGTPQTIAIIVLQKEKFDLTLH